MDHSNRLRGSDVSFLFKIGSSCNIEILSLALTWKSESLVAKMDTI